MHILPDKAVLSELMKKPQNIDDQVLKLSSKGLRIEDPERAKKILLSTNYYYFTGYLHEYKVVSEGCNEHYDTLLSFEDFYSIIQFDMQLRSILLQSIDFIERDLKTKIAYSIALDDLNDGSINYLYEDYFLDRLKNSNAYKVKDRIGKKNLEDNLRKNHSAFISFFESEYSKKLRNSTFLIHHSHKYWGCLPIWVAVEIMTIGNLKKFYEGVLDFDLKSVISNYYNLTPKYLANHLNCLNIFRNILAHNSRLYELGASFSPHILDEDINMRKTHKIFDYVYVLRNLTSDMDYWNCSIIVQLDMLFQDTITKKVPITCWGFPTNWKDLLIKQERE